MFIEEDFCMITLRKRRYCFLIVSAIVTVILICIFRKRTSHISDQKRHVLAEDRISGVSPTLMEKPSTRSMEYCNYHEELKDRDEGAVGKRFKLRSVHIVIRHGDRSPIYKLPNQDAPTLSCTLDAVEATGHGFLVKSFKKAVEASVGRIPHGQRFGWYPRQQTCTTAQLTGTGLVQHLINGVLLNDIYIRNHKLLSDKPHPGNVSIRSTEYSRTYQSALAFMHGLLPGMDLSQLPLTITGNVNFCDGQLGGVSCSCSMLGRLRELAKKEETKMKSDVTSRLISSIKQEVADLYGITTQRVPWIGGIIEVLMGYVCHNLPLPCSHVGIKHGRGTGSKNRCMTMLLVDKMWQYLDARSGLGAGLSEQRYNVLFMYPLLKEIAQQMVNITRDQPTPIITLYSGHDLTITPLVKVLGIYNGHWAPYGSRLVFEMYSSTDTQYYIRVLYNGKDKTSSLKFCKSLLNDQLCPLNQFVDFAFNDLFRVFGNKTHTDICSG